jgi:transcriptional regulator with XRE-family HTH domain
MTTGSDLRDARCRAGIGLSKVASAAGRSTGHLSRIESGERPVSPAIVSAYERALGTTLPDRQAVTASQGSPLGSATGGPGPSGQRAASMGVSPERTVRPAMFPPAGGAAHEEVAAEESVAFARRARMRAMDPEILDRAEEEIRRIAWEYLHAPRQREHHAELVLLRDRVFRWIEDESHRPDQARRLYALAGMSCGLLAQATHELGFRRAGMSHAHAATVCAELAGHSSLTVWVRATQAAIAEYSGLPRETVRYARAGRRHVTRGTASVRLLSLAANGHARLGDVAATEEALTAARAAREAATDTDSLDDVGGVFTVSPAKQHAYAASAYALLGNGARAEQEATQALTLYQAAPAIRRQPVNEGYAHIDVALARLLGGDLDGAGEALAPVFALPRAARVDLFAEKLHRVQTHLTTLAYRDAAATGPLTDQIQDFLITLGTDTPA